MAKKKATLLQFTPQKKLLIVFLKKFWFAPQDVLLRSVEASIFQRVNLKRPILDIGIGDASIAEMFYPKKLIIDVGCDVDAIGIERARGNKKYKKIQVQNAERMSFPNSKFGSVICNSTAEHITHDKQAIKEMGRVLKKGGHLYLTVPSAYLPEMILELERFEGNTHPKRALTRFNDRVMHKHYRTLGDWRKILAAGKMEIITYKYYFPVSTTRTWYELMRWSTTKLLGREIWSWIGHSRFTQFVPKELVASYLKHFKLQPAFTQAFETSNEVGGMVFMLARKK